MPRPDSREKRKLETIRAKGWEKVTEKKNEEKDKELDPGGVVRSEQS